MAAVASTVLDVTSMFVDPLHLRLHPDMIQKPHLIAGSHDTSSSGGSRDLSGFCEKKCEENNPINYESQKNRPGPQRIAWNQ